MKSTSLLDRVGDSSCRTKVPSSRLGGAAYTATTPVDDKDYQVPFRFTGKLNKLTLTIDRAKLTPEDEKKLQAQRNNRVSE